MLFQKLLRPADSSGATGIQYVGAYIFTSSTTSSSVSIPLTALTGGIASSPSIGDLVVVSLTLATGGSQIPSITSSGFTTVAQQLASDGNTASSVVGYKILTSTTTTISVNGNAGTTQSLSAYVSVWRGVDATYPFDVPVSNALGSNTILCDPAAITPSTSGSYIIAFGGGAHGRGVASYSSSDLTGFLSNGADGSGSDSVSGGGYKQWTSGSFNPSTFTFSAADSTSSSWTASTIALRPDTGRVYPSFVASSGIVTGSSVTVPSHQAGDWVVVVNANTTTTPPALLSGYTNITTFGNTATGNNRSARAQYIISDGTISSVSVAGYGLVAVLRNVTSLGAINSVNTTGTVGSTTTVSLSGVVPGSLCLFSSYIGGSQVSSVSGLSFASNFGGYETVGPVDASAGGTITFASVTPACYFGVEFR